MPVHVYDPIGKWVISGAAANNVSGTALDCLLTPPFAISEIKCTGNSAIVDILYSPNNADWATAITVTATNGGTAYQQISAFYPYVNIATRLVYSAAGGSAQVYGYYQPGLLR